MRGKTVVVTGAGAGIGRAVVLACARLGARVAALDVDEIAAHSAADEASAVGAATALALGCDVTDETAVRSTLERAWSTIGPFDGVFANAGVEMGGPLHEFAADDWKRVLEVNLVGVFLTVRESLRLLVDAGAPASIVCTSSPAAFVGFSGGGNSAYAASKGGVSAFVRSAALDYAPAGIRVNAVVPGATDTAMLLAGVPPEQSAAESQRIVEAARTQVPLGRLARPEEVASAVLWLLSDDSSYVTGTNLVCDGGLLAKSANDF
ncbi:MAG: SDR family NAD(P)-dependent oxidoreductase [Nocardioides sp.]